MLNRNDFTTTIRELDGKTVESARAVVRDDEDVVLLVIKVKGGNFHRAMLDTGLLFWTEVKTLDPEDLEDGEVRTLAVDGKRIASIRMAQVGGHGELRIAFAGGGGITLRSEAESLDEERTRLVVD